MKRLLGAALVLVGLTAAPLYAAGVDFVWDNFPVTQDFPAGYNVTDRFTSERDTQHSTGLTAASWTVDDFHIPLGLQGDGNGDGQVVLSSIEWVGVRELFDRPGFGYDRLDYAILTRTFDPLNGTYDFQPLEYGNGQQAVFLNQQVGADWQIEEELGSVPNFPTLFAFRGSVTVPSIPLEPGTDYWVGVRLVGNDVNGDGGTAGRHFVASGSGNPDSVDTAFVHDPPRGGDPWQRITNPVTHENYHAAYRLGMTVVPEPATALLLMLGGLMLAGRTRR